MKESNVPKLSRATASLEKEGKQKRSRIVSDTFDKESKDEINNYLRGRVDSDEFSDSIHRSDESLPDVRE